jgi:hypothetical protein
VRQPAIRKILKFEETAYQKVHTAGRLDGLLFKNKTEMLFFYAEIVFVRFFFLNRIGLKKKPTVF